MTRSISFDRAADYYDRTRAIPDQIRDQLFSMMVAELGTEGACLEIGVGTGRIALPLVEHGIRVVGVDIAREMLQKLVAKRDGSWPQIAAADATRLPFGDRTFDSVLAVHVIHLIPQWRAAADEIGRVLRPGGVFVVSRGGQRRSRWVGDLSRHFFLEAGVGKWPPGVDQITELDAHMAGLGFDVRELPDVRDESSTSVQKVLADLEAGYWSACWSVEPEARREAAVKTRAWAEHELGDLTRPRLAHEYEIWRAYRLAQ